MNAMSVTRTPAPSNSRFVPAVASVSDYEAGRALYRSGKRLADCASDEAARGWLDAELAGALAYSRHMEAEGVPCAQAYAFQGWGA